MDYSEGLEVGYRWYTANHVAPLFTFGYGLSYTSFGEKILGVRPDGRGGVTVNVDVRNTGRWSGTQLVELYVKDPAASGEPSQQLKGFQRIALPAGGSRVVHPPELERLLGLGHRPPDVAAIPGRLPDHARARRVEHHQPSPGTA